MDVYMDTIRNGLVVLEVEDANCEAFDTPKGWIEVTEDLRIRQQSTSRHEPPAGF